MGEPPVPPDHPLLVAIAPLLDRLNAEVVTAGRRDSDVPLVWEGRTLAAVRLPGEPDRSGSESTTGLGALLEDVARELGGPLAALDRAGKQRAVRLLEERGAFHYRKSAETVADALGVTRFTVYNYLNRDRD